MEPLSPTIVNDLRAEIVTKLETSDLFQEVYASPRSTFEGFPVAIVMPSENEAEYGSTDNRRMTFVFHVHIYYPVKNEAEYAKAERAVGECVGEVLNMFLEKNPLTNCDWVIPVPSSWGETAVGEAVYRTSTVVLSCIKYVQVTA